MDDLSLQHDRPQPTRFETMHEASMALYIRRQPTVCPRNSPVHVSRTEAPNIENVRQCINDMLHPRQGKCFLPLKAESMRNIGKTMPTALVPQTYEIETTATYYFGRFHTNSHPA